MCIIFTTYSKKKTKGEKTGKKNKKKFSTRFLHVYDFTKFGDTNSSLCTSKNLKLIKSYTLTFFSHITLYQSINKKKF